MSFVESIVSQISANADAVLLIIIFAAVFLATLAGAVIWTQTIERSTLGAAGSSRAGRAHRVQRPARGRQGRRFSKSPSRRCSIGC